MNRGSTTDDEGISALLSDESTTEDNEEGSVYSVREDEDIVINAT